MKNMSDCVICNVVLSVSVSLILLTLYNWLVKIYYYYYCFTTSGSSELQFHMNLHSSNQLDYIPNDPSEVSNDIYGIIH